MRAKYDICPDSKLKRADFHNGYVSEGLRFITVFLWQKYRIGDNYFSYYYFIIRLHQKLL
jgi:hypothetical protein